MLHPATPRDRTRSEVEREFLELCREYGLPLPDVNVQIGGWTVDFVWAAARLVVEIDTLGMHRGSVGFEDDHERDLDLRRRGYTVHRYTDRQLEREPQLIAGDLAAALGVTARR